MERIKIENPVINFSFEEPKRHFYFTADGITNEIPEQQHISSHFVPAAQPKKKSKQKQLLLSSEWTQERIKENEFIK